MKLVAYIDGSSIGNPGDAAFGVVVKDESGDILTMLGRYIGRNTNNVAEYQGLIGCLELLKDFSIDSLKVYSDSQLLVNQVNGVYRVKQPHLQVLHKQIMVLIDQLKFDFDIEHVRREYNKEADALARRAVKVKKEIRE
ncbi:ribonuclease HI family protein [bacterium]|nr:ribonuclease HI family protein [bacterium]